MKNRTVASLAVAVGVMVMFLPVMVSAVSIDRYVIASGGRGGMSAGSYSLSGTIGQAVVGTMTGGIYTLQSGFWHTVAAAQAPEEIADLTDAKSKADGKLVHTAGKIATTGFSDFTGFFYIEEPDRSSGIRVVATTTLGSVVRGATIEVTGTMATTAAGERYIGQATVSASGTPAVLGPLGMTNKSMGGSNAGNPPLGQYGVVGGSGTNNIGLLVRACGQVVSFGSGYRVIDDGSGVLLRVDTTAAPSIPTSGYVTVTGVSSLYGSAGSAERLLLAIN